MVRIKRQRSFERTEVKAHMERVCSGCQRQTKLRKAGLLRLVRCSVFGRVGPDDG
jgi:hypothetical protein